MAPGDFLALLYVGGEKRAEQAFSLAANEAIDVRLSAATVYFEGFGLVPAYDNKSGDIAFLKVVYTVRNLYRPVNRAEIVLSVTKDGVTLEELPLATIGPLDIGRALASTTTTSPPLDGHMAITVSRCN